MMGWLQIKAAQKPSKKKPDIRQVQGLQARASFKKGSFGSQLGLFSFLFVCLFFFLYACFFLMFQAVKMTIPGDVFESATTTPLLSSGCS